MSFDPDVHVPGSWRCAKCGFRLQQMNLNAQDGTVTSRDQAGDVCPNDGAPLWRVTWKDDAAEAFDQIQALIDENARLREALENVLSACDQGRMVELGAGGMTIEAQIRRSVYNRVPAWPIEEARAALSPNPDQQED